MDFSIEAYTEHSLTTGSTSQAATYVGLKWGDGTVTWARHHTYIYCQREGPGKRHQQQVSAAAAGRFAERRVYKWA